MSTHLVVIMFLSCDSQEQFPQSCVMTYLFTCACCFAHFKMCMILTILETTVSTGCVLRFQMVRHLANMILMERVMSTGTVVTYDQAKRK